MEHKEEEPTLQGKTLALQKVYRSSPGHGHERSKLDGHSKCGLASQPSKRLSKAVEVDDASDRAQASAVKASGGALHIESSSERCCCLSTDTVILQMFSVDTNVEMGLLHASMEIVKSQLLIHSY